MGAPEEERKKVAFFPTGLPSKVLAIMEETTRLFLGTTGGAAATVAPGRDKVGRASALAGAGAGAGAKIDACGMALGRKEEEDLCLVTFIGTLPWLDVAEGGSGASLSLTRRSLVAASPLPPASLKAFPFQEASESFKRGESSSSPADAPPIVAAGGLLSRLVPVVGTHSPATSLTLLLPHPPRQDSNALLSSLRLPGKGTIDTKAE